MDHLASLVKLASLDEALPLLEKRAEEVRSGQTKEAGLGDDIGAGLTGAYNSVSSGLGQAKDWVGGHVGNLLNSSEAGRGIKNWWDTNPYRGAMTNAAIGAAGGAALGGIGSMVLGPKDRKRPLSGALMGGLLGGAVGGGYGMLPHLQSIGRKSPAEEIRGPATEVPRQLNISQDESDRASFDPRRHIDMMTRNLQNGNFGTAAWNMSPTWDTSRENLGTHAAVGTGIALTPLAFRGAHNLLADPSRAAGASAANSPLRNMTWGQATRSSLGGWLPGSSQEDIVARGLVNGQRAVISPRALTTLAPTVRASSIAAAIGDSARTSHLNPQAVEALRNLMTNHPNPQQALNQAMRVPDRGLFGRAVEGIAPRAISSRILPRLSAPGLEYGEALTRGQLRSAMSGARPSWMWTMGGQLPLQALGHYATNRALDAQSLQASGATSPELSGFHDSMQQVADNLRSNPAIPIGDPRITPPALPSHAATDPAWQTPRGQALREAHAQYLQQLEILRSARPAR